MDFAAGRAAMVRDQIAGRGIVDARVLAAMGTVPREAFVPTDLMHRAYDDGPLPIAAGQTISQPYIVALMLASAEVAPDDHVLEIGAGSGYATAIVARIAGSVVAVERHRELADAAAARLARLGTHNVTIVHGDASAGRPENAPYDVVLAAAAAARVPDALLAQLKPGGRLVMPVGAAGGVQELIKVVVATDGTARRETLGAVRFVPLIGAESPSTAG